MYDIGDFRDRDLSAQKLGELDTILEKAWEDGLMVVLRAAYGFDETSAYNDPKEISRITGHIKQIKPILQKYGDILYTVQAGFLGEYGEWHSSNYGDPPSADAQAAVLNELLDGLPENVSVCVRRPSFIRALFAQGKLDQAYADRIGVHNDALLGSADDYGTYTDWSREEELAWAAAYFKKLPYGGETCCPSEYAEAQNAVREFSMLHLSYLNSAYNLDVLDGWKGGRISGTDAYDYIGRHMGYRFTLRTAGLSPDMKPGSELSAVLRIGNTGFASMCSGFGASLVIEGGDTLLTFPIQTEVCGWLPGEDAEIKLDIEMPGEITGDTLRLGIKIAALGETTAGDSRYTVALQNEGIDYSGGVNYFATYQKTDEGYELYTGP